MAWLLKTQRRYTTAMERHQAFRFELRENGEQRRQVRRYAGSVRLVYNHALALQKEM
jgi:putative transposase